MKEAIQKYFEELIKTDTAIAEVYQEEKLAGCCAYIQKQARKQIKGSAGYIEDAVVFKWARDYMLGDIAEEDKPKTVTPQKEEPAEPTEEVEQTEETETEEENQPEEKKEENITENGENSKDDFEEISSGEIKKRCSDCGYINKSESCHQDEGICLLKRNNGFADVVKLQSIACSQFTEEEKKPDAPEETPTKEKDFEEVTSGEVHHQHFECGHYRRGGKCLLHKCAIPNSGSKACDEFSKDVVHRCIECGYCDKEQKRCLFHKYAIREDLLALACSEFIVAATPKDIEEVKANPVTEAPKPAAPKKEKKNDDNDGPFLFDFMNE